MKKITILFIFLFLIACKGKKGAQLTLVSGDINGNYHKGALILQKFAEKHGLNIDVQSSDGSFDNVLKVGRGQAHLGFSQMDVLVYFDYLEGDYKEASKNSLAIAPIELEYFHVLVNNNSNFKNLDDVKVKKFGIGSSRSGTQFTFGVISNLLYKLDVRSPNLISGDEEEAIKKVVSGELDGAFLVSTVGTKLLANVPKEANVRLLSYEKNEFPEQLKNYYATYPIPAGTYPFQKEALNVPTVMSFLIANNNAPQEALKQLIKLFYENEDKLDKQTNLFSENASEVYERLSKAGIPYHPLVVE
ncbi:MAG: TAXI family TRAP transporter solute-binding subunit, partial [Leptospiraceae bacterium]|nr:TAXI family TRAP transporter solute-binding subunit [Leptospiraceae bacterium]